MSDSEEYSSDDNSSDDDSESDDDSDDSDDSDVPILTKEADPSKKPEDEHSSSDSEGDSESEKEDESKEKEAEKAKSETQTAGSESEEDASSEEELEEKNHVVLVKHHGPHKHLHGSKTPTDNERPSFKVKLNGHSTVVEIGDDSILVSGTGEKVCDFEDVENFDKYDQKHHVTFVIGLYDEKGKIKIVIPLEIADALQNEIMKKMEEVEAEEEGEDDDDDDESQKGDDENEGDGKRLKKAETSDEEEEEEGEGEKDDEEGEGGGKIEVAEEEDEGKQEQENQEKNVEVQKGETSEEEEEGEGEGDTVKDEGEIDEDTERQAHESEALEVPVRVPDPAPQRSNMEEEVKSESGGEMEQVEVEEKGEGPKEEKVADEDAPKRGDVDSEGGEKGKGESEAKGKGKSSLLARFGFNADEEETVEEQKPEDEEEEEVKEEQEDDGPEVTEEKSEGEVAAELVKILLEQMEEANYAVKLTADQKDRFSELLEPYANLEVTLEGDSDDDDDDDDDIPPPPSMGDSDEDDDDIPPPPGFGDDSDDDDDGIPPPPGFGDDDDDDDDDGPPPPPPGAGGPVFDMFAKKKEVKVKEEKVKYLRQKFIETEKIVLGKIPKNKLKSSIFGQGKIIEKSGRYFSSTISKHLLQHFQAARPKKDEKRERSGATSKKDEKKFFLVDTQKSLNASIILRSIGGDLLETLKQSGELEEDSFDKVEKVLSMYSTDEKQKIAMFDVENLRFLGKADKFVYDLHKIPMVEDRVRCLSFRKMHDFYIKGMREDLEKFLKVTIVLKDSEEFKEFLGFILGVANFLNKSASAGGDPSELNHKELYYGINIRSLSNLAKMKSKENKQESLLDLIYRLIHYKNKKILSFADSLYILKEIIGVRLITKETMLNDFKTKVEFTERLVDKVSQNRKVGEANIESFKDSMKKFIPLCKFETIEIEKMLEKVKKNLGIIAKLYGQDEEQMEDFLVDLNEFLILFKKSEEQFVKREKKQARKRKRAMSFSGKGEKMNQFETIRKNTKLNEMFNDFNEKSMTIRMKRQQEGPKKMKTKKATIELARKENMMTLFGTHNKLHFSKAMRGKIFDLDPEKIEVLVMDDFLYIFRTGNELMKMKMDSVLLKKKRDKVIFFHILKSAPDKSKLKFHFKKKDHCEKFCEVFFKVNGIGNLTVHLKEGKHLRPNEYEREKLNAYVVFKLGWYEDDVKQLSKKSKKSSVIKDTNHPKWHEKHELPLVDPKNNFLQIHVLDYDRMEKDVLLGEKTIGLKDIEFGKKSRILLDGSDREGSISMKFTFEELGSLDEEEK